MSFNRFHKKERTRFFEQSTFQPVEDAPIQTDLLKFVQKYFHSSSEQSSEDSKYSDPKGVWAQLEKLVQLGDDGSLKKIAEMARESSRVYIPCFLNAIGQFKGNDQAVLKLLDYIRVEEEYLIKSVIGSLSSVGTVRAGGELIAMLQRPNISRDHQLFIASALKDFDHSKMQSEISSVILDFQAKPEPSDDTVEIIETLSSFIVSQPNPSSSDVVKITSGDSDQKLQDAYKGFENLSGEVRRALRTGMFFHQEVKKSDASIDLSPVIDMQYKAIELYLREAFERRCMELVKSGVLQRKLDIIGYARPIPAKMSQFENYMSSLPEINKIPFFSKFKLRKMLRALCQYKPGKRFTLDGLKAFALFFLCFSRSECKYGLSNLFPLGFATDKDLHLFVCELHRFQDFRNRAVHEGLPPDVVQEIDQTWQTTFSALSEVDRLLMIEKHMKQMAQAKGA